MCIGMFLRRTVEYVQRTRDKISKRKKKDPKGVRHAQQRTSMIIAKELKTNGDNILQDGKDDDGL